jgi:hypothetical protein
LSDGVHVVDAPLGQVVTLVEVRILRNKGSDAVSVGHRSVDLIEGDHSLTDLGRS